MANTMMSKVLNLMTVLLSINGVIAFTAPEHNVTEAQWAQVAECVRTHLNYTAIHWVHVPFMNATEFKVILSYEQYLKVDNGTGYARGKRLARMVSEIQDCYKPLGFLCASSYALEGTFEADTTYKVVSGKDLRYSPEPAAVIDHDSYPYYSDASEDCSMCNDADRGWYAKIVRLGQLLITRWLPFTEKYFTVNGIANMGSVIVWV